ncbi:hypothetical protein ABZW18_05100 [Streptomyces sp. NPDC004647]|uniref:hypothetical protein n=1 Tax=Streptomyces sp. NPDC004647 TaxID=3154671 RepID=UPI0033AE0AEC
MSTARTPEPVEPPEPAQAAQPAESAAKLNFEDPLGRQSTDDTDRGWGEAPTGGGTSTADLARFLDEKPPHHL